MQLALMLEGQNGLNWAHWQRWVQAAETLGFAGLYRSDHFTNGQLPDLDSLELWTSLTWLADQTRRIEFGPLVTPVSFRHPVFTARMAKDVDDLSGGRLRLGIGAGWQQREHEIFGFDLLEPDERFDRFEESVQVIRSLLKQEGPVDFTGRYFNLKGAQLLPRPQRPGGPPLVIGGTGEKRTLPLAARYADEWNAVMIPLEEFSRLNGRLDELLAAEGRSPGGVRRTLMHQLAYGQDAHTSRDWDAYRRRGGITGTAGEVIDQLGRWQDAGLHTIMLQWLRLDDMTGLEDFAARVLPHFPNPEAP